MSIWEDHLKWMIFAALIAIIITALNCLYQAITFMYSLSLTYPQISLALHFAVIVKR